jgi:CheY-like chemotaxis protein
MTFPSSFRGFSPHEEPLALFTSSDAIRAVEDSRTIAMIVDDEPKTAELLCRAFIDSGIPTVYTTSSNEAIALACRERPRIILIDLLIQRLHDIGPVADLPAIEYDYIQNKFWGAILVRRMQQMPELAGTSLMIMSCLRPRLPGMADIPFISKPFSDIRGLIRRVRGSAGME